MANSKMLDSLSSCSHLSYEESVLLSNGGGNFHELWKQSMEGSINEGNIAKVIELINWLYENELDYLADQLESKLFPCFVEN